MDHAATPAEIGRAATHTGTATVHITDTTVLLTVDGHPVRLSPTQASVLGGLLGRAANALIAVELPPHDGYRIGGRHDTIDDPEIVELVGRIAARLNDSDLELAEAYEVGRQAGLAGCRRPGRNRGPRPGWTILNGGLIG